ncbi:MAG TPA: hypothetical protein PLX89_10395, partial [Verrucomicrobiota bacterium]|nr:hypothetical protein [Verrucomicrobiota bacterium]
SVDSPGTIDIRSGRLFFGGTFTLGPSSQFNLVVDARGAPAILGGNSTLDGSLRVSFGNEFSPTSSFVVLMYGGRAGTFASISGPSGIRLQPTYRANDLILQPSVIQLQLTTPTFTTAGVPILSLHLDAEVRVLIQKSRDLETWETIFSALIPAGLFEWNDPTDAVGDSAYYRATIP